MKIPLQLKKLSQSLLITATAFTVTVPTVAQNNPLSSLFGQSQKGKFLPVHQAFKVQTSQQGNTLTVNFDITPEHYIYKDKVTISLPDDVVATAPQFNLVPTMVDDPEFGHVAVFEQDVVATFNLKSEQNLTNVPITVKWQGCAKAGLCYPPETIKTTITLSATPKAVGANEQTTSPKSQTTHVTPKPNPSGANPQQIITEPHPKTDSIVTPVPSDSGHDTDINRQIFNQADNLGDRTDVTNGATASDIPMSAGEPNESPLPQSSFTSESGVIGANDINGLGAETDNTPENLPNTATTNQIPNDADRHTAISAVSDPFGIKERPVWAVMLLFLAGLLLAFTPCVYPMIPIVANIVARQKNTSSGKGFMLSAGYGVGVATAYGILGAIIAGLGQAVGILGWLQNTYILAIFAILFVVLALAMFDVIHVRLPHKLSSALQQKSQLADGLLGSVGGSFVVGLLSALVVSPCVSLPMAGALTAVATSDSVMLGFVALFGLGLGLSIPLMIMGALQGKFMPKAGEWTVYVKQFCGLLLLAVAVSLLERITVGALVLGAWALWFALFGVWVYRIGKIPLQAAALISGAWSLCLVMGVASGASDPWKPLANLGTSSHQQAQIHDDLHIKTLGELDDILAKHDKVLVDVTADWCIECRIMERTLFANRPQGLSAYQVVKLDVTETTDDSRAVLQRYGLFGPPALLIYHNNQLQKVLLGEVKRVDFEQAL